MKKLYFIVFAFLFSGAVSGQDLRIPSTPAFSILDYEPSAVMRPSSVKKLSSDILNSFDAKGKLQMNIGIEVLPYWLKNRPDLTLKEYYEPNVFQTIKQSFSISAATVKDTITGNNNFGAGFRLQVYKGKLDTKADETYVKNQRRLSDIRIIVASISAAIPDNSLMTKHAVVSYLKGDLAGDVPQELIDDVEFRASEIMTGEYFNRKKFCEALNDSYSIEKSGLIKEIIEVINRRRGFNVEFAGASKFVTSGDKKAFQKSGAWVNISNYVSVNDAFTLTARWMQATVTDTIKNNTDVGLSYIRQDKNLNVSVEAMWRWYDAEFPDINLLGQPIRRTEKDFTYRVAAQVSYIVVNDVSVNFSLGKDFKDPGLSTNGYFSILGLNYTLFNKDNKAKPE
jgi:hypothetical protein